MGDRIMTVVEWFDPKKADHMSAYKILRETGQWPQGFIPEALEFPNTWVIELTEKVLVHIMSGSDPEEKGYPGCLTPEEWERILDDMIVGFDLLVLEQIKPLTPLEFTKAVRTLARDYDGDPEAYGGRCGDLMEELLITLGYEKGIEVMRSHERY